MILNFKLSYGKLLKEDYILIKNRVSYKNPKPYLKIFSFNSNPSILHSLIFLDIIYGLRPKLIPQRGGQINLRKKDYYYFSYLLYLEILPRQSIFPFFSQINFKQHTEFDNFQKFYAYFYGQPSFFFQYQFNYN